MKSGLSMNQQESRQAPIELQRDIERDRAVIQNISNLLQLYRTLRIDFKQYCEVCRLATFASPTYLITSYEKYMLQGSQQQAQSNSRNLAKFLCSPNILYVVSERLQQKEQQKRVEAGKKIVSTIAYAWDYYFRLLRETAKLSQNGNIETNRKKMGIYTQENVKMALRRIEEMLSEMEANKYHWQFYTKEGLAKLFQQKKQMEEEQVFSKLLQNMIEMQIQKISRRRCQESEENIRKQNQQAQQPKTIGIWLQEDNGSERKNISCVLNISKYLRQRYSQEKLRLDAIEQCHQRRKFNSMAFKYYFMNHQR